ncbi:protein phosphatase 2C domain-containing protein [Treponema primitia]|uniref:PP2C family serine/threonine-protein phosphatase n=1 Tax=Treponema primitia TaxID=88058 RepID=UPI003980F909
MTVKQEQADRLSFLGISHIGESHIKKGSQNQDAIAFNLFGDSFFIAVSDGLGSCKRSHIGAQTAVSLCNEIFLKVMDNHLDFLPNVIVDEILALWLKSFSEAELKEYSATLKAVFLKDGTIIAVSIGDGFLFIQTNGKIHTLEGKGGDFVNETECLSYALKESDVKTLKLSKGNELSILLCTDGISSSITDGMEQAFFEEISAIDDIKDLQDQLIAMLSEISKVNTDDKTIGIVKNA